MVLRSFTITLLLLLALFSGHSAAYHSNEQALFAHVDSTSYFLPTTQSAANESALSACSGDSPANDNAATAAALQLLVQAIQHSVRFSIAELDWEFVSLAAHLIRGPPIYF